MDRLHSKAYIGQVREPHALHAYVDSLHLMGNLLHVAPEENRKRTVDGLHGYPHHCITHVVLTKGAGC